MKGWTMGLRIFDRLFRRGEREKLPPEEPQDYYYEGPPETEDTGLLVDHHFEYLPESDYDKHIGKMVYQIEIENNTDFPMGNLRVEFPKRFKLGSFGKPSVDGKLVDPGERISIKAPFTPSYMGGSEQFEFDIRFFDFKYKVEEAITMKSEPLKVLVPKFQKMTLDEDGFRLLTGDLFRWSTETEVINVPPEKLFSMFVNRLKEIGFSTSKEMINESMYRGIRQMVSKDKKGRKWAVQVQVIGSKKESKVLFYTFGERPLQAYNLAVKVLLKLEGRDQIIDSLLK
ncbi:MAG: hypothetical protein ACMUIE_08580 [Thermoplasmatota archaeon]